MRRKDLWKHVSWLLTAGLVISNPAHLRAAERITENTSVQTETTSTETEEGTESSTETEEATEPATETEGTTETSTESESTASSESEEETQVPATETPQTSTESESESAASTEQETSGQTEEQSEREEERKKAAKQPEEEKEQTEESQTGQEQQSSESQQQSETETGGSNEQLLAGQTFYQVEKIEEDFRFVTVEEEIAVAKEDLKIYEEKDTSARAVGTLNQDGVCYVLKQEDGWIYVESGVVRGFVQEDALLMGQEASKKMDSLQGEGNQVSLAFPVEKLKKDSETQEGMASYAVSVEALDEEKEEQEYTVDWNALTFATPLVDPVENQAIAYTRTTTRETVCEKIYAVAEISLSVSASLDPDGEEEAGTLEKGGLCYILADEGSDRVYIESGDVRGFVDAANLITGEKAQRLVEEKGEENFTLAEESMEPEENPVLYYTLTSTKKGQIASAIRTSMVKFATSFIGNPYVWGGTSLTQGADCSGFVQSIYAEYGYSIPRVAADQAQYGTKIRVSDAEPGDLIFYAKDGEIYHVVMYIGEGKVVEAAGTGIGIITANLNTERAVWATRIITDADEDVIEKVNQKTAVYETADEEDYGEYLGKFKLTSYCTCAICCGQWANGVTASGAMPTEGRTVAMAGVPFGTRLVIGGQIYVVEDRGTPYGHVDIYKNLHQDCSQFGVQYADVYLAK